MSFFLELGNVILTRLKSELTGIQNFVTASSIDNFIAFSSPPNSIAVIYNGYETNDDKLDNVGRSKYTQHIQQTWIVILKVRDYTDLRQFEKARVRASKFIDDIIKALDGWKPHTVDTSYNHMILRLTNGKTEPITKDGTLYIPFYFKSIYQVVR